MTAKFPTPAWLVGCGNMAGAMVQGWQAGSVDLSGVTVIRPSGMPVEGVRTVTDYPDEDPHFVMLGFKPQKLDSIEHSLARFISPSTVLVSMLAGVSAASLRERFPQVGPIVRIMPNLPVAQGQGVIALYAEGVGDSRLAEVRRLMASLGMVADCGSEAELSVIGAVSAAGVAYVARFAAALARGGESLGLNPDLADQIAVQTLIGTGIYAADGSVTMPEIARRVASPGGTTEQGLALLDGEQGLQSLVNRTLEAAVRRGEEIASQTRRN